MRVAVAVITDAQQRVLITQRALGAPHGGLWEFPGGKLEIDELPASALIREVKEEVGLEVTQFEYLGEVNHTYGQQDVCLLVYHIVEFVGKAECLEAQMGLCWVEIESLKNYNFPAANIEIIHLIQQKIEAPCL